MQYRTIVFVRTQPADIYRVKDLIKMNNMKRFIAMFFSISLVLFSFTSVSYADIPVTPAPETTAPPTTLPITPPDTTPTTIGLDDPLPSDTTPVTKGPSAKDVAAEKKANAANKSLDKATQKLLETQLKVDLTTLQMQETVAKISSINDQIDINSAKLAINEMPTAQLKKEIQYRAIKLYQDNSGEPADDLAELYKRRVSTLANSVQHSSTQIFSTYQKRISELDKIEKDLNNQQSQALTLQADLEKQNQQLALDFEDAKKEYAKQSKTFLDASGLISARLPVDGKVCPIAGPLTHVNDFGNNRSGGRSHKGNDIFNASGTPNVAIVGGTTQFLDGGLGGTGIFLHGDDGNIYYYAHLLSRVGTPRRVAMGELIAYTGATGNAAGGAAHTHFEIRLGGTVHVNPYPILRIICGV